MKVLLANPPWKVNGKIGVRAGSRWPHLKIPEEEDYLPYPFFLGYATSLLKENGYEAILKDAIAEDMDINKFIRFVNKINPDLILMEVSTPSIKNDLKIINSIKEISDTKIAITGPDANIRNTEFLKQNKAIDFVLIGEYEYTLLDLVKALDEGKKLNQVLGIIYRCGNKIIKNRIRPLIQDLNELPWPDREQVPIFRYHDSPGGMSLPTAQMIASRGCPYRCIFCAWPQLMYHGSNYRVRSVMDVVSEMEFLVEMGFKSIYFDDDTFNIGKERLFKLCNEIKRRNLDIPWAIMARPDLMDRELLEEFKSAGLYAVKYGVESANQKLLDKANKRMDLHKVIKNIKLTQRLGIKVHLTFTFGLPGENRETIKKTIDLALKLNPESVQFSIATPFPGTDYYYELENKGFLISKNWEEYDGNYRSVIRTEYLDGEDLENALRVAYNKWNLYKINIKRYKNSPVKLFNQCLKEHGLKYTLKKTFEYISKRNFRYYLK